MRSHTRTHKNINTRTPESLRQATRRHVPSGMCMIEGTTVHDDGFDDGDDDECDDDGFDVDDVSFFLMMMTMV